MDLMLDKKMKVWMCEVNTDPGLGYPEKEAPWFGPESVDMCGLKNVPDVNVGAFNIIQYACHKSEAKTLVLAEVLGSPNPDYKMLGG